MLDQHVAVAIGQNVCNLSAPPTGREDHQMQILDSIFGEQKKTAQRQCLWAANIWWALEDLNFRPLPCQVETDNHPRYIATFATHRFGLQIR